MIGRNTLATSDAVQFAPAQSRKFYPMKIHIFKYL